MCACRVKTNAEETLRRAVSLRKLSAFKINAHNAMSKANTCKIFAKNLQKCVDSTPPFCVIISLLVLDLL